MTDAQLKQDFYPLAGGLDTMTPALMIDPGKCFDAQNYEPVITGGYRRIDGYERFDGRLSPTASVYWLLTIAQTGVVNVGDTLTGATSAATLKVLAISGSMLVAGRVTGTFVLSESLNHSGIVGSITSLPQASSAPAPIDDANYMLLAANDRRADIGSVPGSGPVRGVWRYKGIVYAFRDNVGATASLMYKATATGWTPVAFGTELLFSAGLAAGSTIGPGTIITNGTATAVVVIVLLRTGTWGNGAAGSLIITPLSGSFANGDTIDVVSTPIATAASASTQITRLPGGTMEFCSINFTGSISTQKMYGVDGVNPAFEFDGTNYVPIHTGSNPDLPTHVINFKESLFLSIQGNVEISGLGNPYSWDVLQGAASFGVGDTITGFVPNGGTYQTGSTMSIFTDKHLYTLYGTSSIDYKLVTSIWDMGFSAGTMQPVSNDTYGWTSRGIQTIITTLTFGDFDYNSISHEIQSLINVKQGLQISSTSLHAKDQYRVYFSDGTALTVGLTGDKMNGIMPLNYGLPVRCICTDQTPLGPEVTYFGSDNGFVYQDNIGTSQDGNPIEAWIRLAFNHTKSPRVRKRYRRAIFEGVVESFSMLNISYDLGYGNADVQPSAPAADMSVNGSGGYWDQFTWDQFTWDAQVYFSPTLSIDGTEKNISFLVYSNYAQFRAHTFQGVTLIYTPRRLER